MKINDIIMDTIINSRIFEMAYQRKRAIDKISNFQEPIAIHLIKYFYYSASKETKQHWKKELDVWFKSIRRIKLKNNKTLEGNQYYKLLFTEPLGERINVEDIIDDINYDENMKEMSGKMTISELHVKLEKLLHTISYDISNNKFKTINDYL